MFPRLTSNGLRQADTDTFAARICGDSMQPKYSEGDVVIFDPTADIADGDDCFVRFDDGDATFKRIYREGDQVRLHPINEKYRDQTVPAERVEMWRAVLKYTAV